MKFEKRRFCAFVGAALCAALVFAGAGVFGDMPGEPQEPPDSLGPCPPPFDGYFVVLPSPPVLRRGFCIVEHSARGGTTPGQERLAMELERDLTRTRTNAEIEWEANTKGPADEIFVKTKVKGTLNEFQQARVDAIAASLEAGGEKAKIKIEVEVAPVEEVLAARAEIGAEQLSALAEIEALGKARFGEAFELPAPRRRYDSLINAVLLDLPGELAGPAKALPGVRDVQHNSEVTPQMDESVPVTGADLAHSAIPPIVGTGVRVAVIDTGVDYEHPALDGRVVNPTEGLEDATPPPNGDGCPGLCGEDDDGDGLIDEDSSGLQPGEFGYTNDLVDDDDEDGFADNLFGIDFGDNDGDPGDDGPGLHGTHVASIIAGEDCLTGMAPEAQIVAVKIFKSAPSPGDFPTMADVVDALEWVVNEAQPGAPEPRAEVANISLGVSCGHPQDMAATAADSAVLNGVVVVAPSGKGNDLEINSPGTAANAITVTPYTIGQFPEPWDDFWAGGAEGYTRYTDSSRAAEDRALFKPDLVAPGVHGSPTRSFICAARTTLVDFVPEDPPRCPQFSCEVDSINYVFGQPFARASIATAHVSGAAALLLGENPSWTPYDAGQNQVVNKVKDALVNRALLLPPDPPCCPFFYIDCVRTCDAGFLGVGNGRLMVKSTTETGALDTDFLVRPSTLSFGEVTTCDTGIVRTETLFVEDLNVPKVLTFTADGVIETCPTGNPPMPLIDLDVTEIVEDEEFEVKLTQTGDFTYPEHCHGYKGIVTVTPSVGDPIRVPWFLAVRDEINRPSGQCRQGTDPILFMPGGGVVKDGQLPVDRGTCEGEEAIWRVAACGFSADTKVCFGWDQDGNECDGVDVLKEPGSFCPTGKNTGATIDVVVPMTPVGAKVVVAIHDGCTSFILGTHTYVEDEPGASFTHDALDKCVGDEVEFEDRSTNLPRAWEWDFGDGGISFEQNPVHTFEAGTYEVTLEVTNPCGSVDSFSDTVTMGASFTHDAPKCIGAPTVQFTNISAGSPTSLSWDFDYVCDESDCNDNIDNDEDGLVDDFQVMGTGQSPTYTYPAAGTYTVALKASGDLTCPAPTTFSDTVRIIGPPTISSVSPPFGTTLGGTEVTVEGAADLFDSLNPSVTFTGASGSFTVPATGSPNGTELTFVTPSLPPDTYSVEVITDCGTSNALTFKYANIGFSAQEGSGPGSGTIEILDVDNNVSLDTLTLTSFVFTPREIAVTRAIGPAVEPQLYVLDSNMAGIPFLLSKPLGNPEAIALDRSFFFDAVDVDEIPNALAPDPVDAGLVYVTSITKQLDPTQPAGVRVFDVSGDTIVSDINSDRIADDLIELHNCIDDGTGHCVHNPRVYVRRTFATDIEVIAVNPTDFGVPFQVDDPVTMIERLVGCHSESSKASMVRQRYGYATNSASVVGGGLEGRSRLSVLDLNPCVITSIDPATGDIAAAKTNPAFQTEVAVFGPATGKGVPPTPGPAEALGLTLARNDEGAFIYALNKRVPPDGTPVALKIDAVTRDFAYNKMNIKRFGGESKVPNARDVVVIQRNLNGDATKLAAINGVTGELFSNVIGSDVVTLEANLGGAADDIAVNDNFSLLYVSLPGTNEVARIETSGFTELPRFGGFTDPRGLVVGADGRLYVCQQSEDSIRVVDAGTGAFVETISGAFLSEPRDVAFELEAVTGKKILAVLEFGGGAEGAGRVQFIEDDGGGWTEGPEENGLSQPMDIVLEEPGVFVVAELGLSPADPQTGTVRLFKTQSGSKKIIRGQFGASGVDILGDHGLLPGSTCIDWVCPGKRYVVSDFDLGRLLRVEKPVILITGVSPNDTVAVGEGAQQQVWVCSGEPGDPTADGSTNIINVFRTRDDSEVVQTVPPFPTEVPINHTDEFTPAECSAKGLTFPCGPFAPTSMAVADFPVSGEKKVFVTMFDSGVVLVYDADTVFPFTQFQLHPTNGGKIFVGAGPRRIVIQPEIVEAP